MNLVEQLAIMDADRTIVHRMEAHLLMCDLAEDTMRVTAGTLVPMDYKARV